MYRRACVYLQVMISMNLCLLVGLSVDYVVHMAEAYYHAPNRDRMGKVQYMLEHIGVSVLYGALTTIGASIFMLFAQLQFFLQFGTFLLCTIGFSLVYSLTIFTAVLSMIGPEGKIGDISVPFRLLKLKILGRSKLDVDCGECQGKGFVSTKSQEHQSKTNISADNVCCSHSALKEAYQETVLDSGPAVPNGILPFTKKENTWYMANSSNL